MEREIARKARELNEPWRIISDKHEEDVINRLVDKDIYFNKGLNNLKLKLKSKHITGTDLEYRRYNNLSLLEDKKEKEFWKSFKAKKRTCKVESLLTCLESAINGWEEEEIDQEIVNLEINKINIEENTLHKEFKSLNNILSSLSEEDLEKIINKELKDIDKVSGK